MGQVDTNSTKESESFDETIGILANRVLSAAGLNEEGISNRFNNVKIEKETLEGLSWQIHTLLIRYVIKPLLIGHKGNFEAVKLATSAAINAFFNAMEHSFRVGMQQEKNSRPKIFGKKNYEHSVLPIGLEKTLKQIQQDLSKAMTTICSERQASYFASSADVIKGISGKISGNLGEE